MCKLYYGLSGVIIGYIIALIVWTIILFFAMKDLNIGDRVLAIVILLIFYYPIISMF